MNKRFVKGLCVAPLAASVGCTANNFCSAERRSLDMENFFVAVYRMMVASNELGKDFSEVNKIEVENAYMNLIKIAEIFGFPDTVIDENEFEDFNMEFNFLDNFNHKNLWWIDGDGLYPLTKSYYMNNRTDGQKKAADFIKKLVQR